MNIIIGILIPFIGTTLGATLVFFMKNNLNPKVENILSGFASGVMVAASIWSLIIPSIESAENQNIIGWIPATIGFIIGILCLTLFDVFIDSKLKGKNREKNNRMLFWAVTLHNIPEGMAVGVIFAGVIAKNIGITIASAFSLAIGIAIQNFPEGAIISMPIRGSKENVSKTKSFLYGVLSGIVEPIAAFGTLFFTNMVIPMLPYVLAFAAGAMFYVVINELLPGKDKFKITTIGFTFGFLIMMILDVSLG